MLHNKTGFRKTKRGKVLRLTREHYLRDDIWCGYEACTICQQDSERACLPKLKSNTDRVYPIIHSSVMLNQIDLLEHPVSFLAFDHLDQLLI